MKLRAARAELAIPLERVERRILMLRRQKVMLDADLAELYGITDEERKTIEGTL